LRRIPAMRFAHVNSMSSLLPNRCPGAPPTSGRHARPVFLLRGRPTNLLWQRSAMSHGALLSFDSPCPEITGRPQAFNLSLWNSLLTTNSDPENRLLASSSMSAHRRAWRGRSR
jgi:hypothetical protein